MYASWVREWTSLVTYIVESNQCTVYLISVPDLIKLSKEIIPLADRIKRAKLRIQNKLVDDIDYFTFSKKMFEANV